MIIGVTPFFNRNRNTMLEKIKRSKVLFPDRAKYKIEYSDEVKDFIVKVRHLSKWEVVEKKERRSIRL
jgi:hypothetical protein